MAERRKRRIAGIPVLKLPPQYLPRVLMALHDHEYDREGFKSAVVEIFRREKDEKSVFRGMAIPTLRSLGLMLGFEQEMRLSADGALVLRGLESKPADKRALQLVLAKLEDERGLDIWRVPRLSKGKVVERLTAHDSPGGSAEIGGETRRRIQRWIAYLQFAGLVRAANDGTLTRLNAHSRSLVLSKFLQELRAAYEDLSPRSVGEPVVLIEDLRRRIAERLYGRSVIVTKRRFDELLAKAIGRQSLEVHLHKSMGAEQDLFMFQGAAYESLSIRESHG